MDQTFQAGEVGGVTCIEVKPIAMCGGSDQEVCEPPPGCASLTDDGGHNEAVASGGANIEGDRLESRFHFL